MKPELCEPDQIRSLIFRKDNLPSLLQPRDLNVCKLKICVWNTDYSGQ
jgi:hypothetical protein